MTEGRLPRAELLAKAGDGDFLCNVAEAVVRLLMETDVEGMIGAGRHERSGERTTDRNGYRDWTLDTRLGSLQLRIPKLRQGSYFPPFLEPRKTTQKALVAVIQEARRKPFGFRRDWRRVHAQGGRPGAGYGPEWHQQEHGFQAVQGHRRPRGNAERLLLGWVPFSTARSRATGPAYGWTRPTSSSARAGGSSRLRR